MISIKFNKHIYSKKAIEKAIKEYRNIGKFMLTLGGKYYRVKIRSIKEAYVQAPVADEFCNYVLAESMCI